MVYEALPHAGSTPLSDLAKKPRYGSVRKCMRNVIKAACKALRSHKFRNVRELHEAEPISRRLG